LAQLLADVATHELLAETNDAQQVGVKALLRGIAHRVRFPRTCRAGDQKNASGHSVGERTPKKLALFLEEFRQVTGAVKVFGGK